MKASQRSAQAPSAQQSRKRSPLLASQETNETQVLEEEFFDDGEDPMLHPPMWLFCLGGLETFWGGASNFFQIITSWVGITGWLQHDLGKSAGGGSLQTLGFALVAAVLSIGSQIGIQAFTQQISKSWKKKRTEEHESTKQVLIEIASEVSIGQIFGCACILICAWSDYTFVTQVDTTGSFGSYILMSFWALILGGSSTYVLMDGIQRIWSGLLALRAWNLWQESLNKHFEELARQYQR